jgi:hypothetical protein
VRDEQQADEAPVGARGEGATVKHTCKVDWYAVSILDGHLYKSFEEMTEQQACDVAELARRVGDAVTVEAFCPCVRKPRPTRPAMHGEKVKRRAR